ncbi:MAG TPA: methylenetetrahydrofolate reductase [NAD(P)H] [Coxiellaceae bacterium]|nr:methylenetetrahydrofolate reductase [NAD(P)H] [Coxiellaceae bacterium]
MNISFEFFPPKTDAGLDKLIQTAETLSHYSPSYFSVTYGAGGSAQTETLNTVNRLRLETSRHIVPHISCVGSTKQSISTLLSTYQKMNIKKLVVLRGDFPENTITQPRDFSFACDLINFIRLETGNFFDIEVAVYPECHPQSTDLHHDLQYFKQKVDAGATGAITQYFYDANAYYWLLENCAREHIDIPITPGIMPISDIQQLTRFSKLCGAELPRWMQKQFVRFEKDDAALQAFGAEVVATLCQRLIAMGAPGLHFYTLNKAAASEAVLKKLAIVSHTVTS